MQPVIVSPVHQRVNSAMQPVIVSPVHQRVNSAMRPVIVQPIPAAYNQFQPVQVVQPAAAAVQVQDLMRAASFQMQAAVNQARQAMANAAVSPRLVTPMPLSFNLQRNMGYNARPAAPQKVRVY